jgi:iron complex outermembrane receptor protein
LAYASATRGFKSGGFNLASPEAGRGYAPEWAWSYEGGLKTVVASGRVRLSAAAFHTDYTDLQVMSTFRPSVIDISNAAAATIRGVEVEGEMQLRRALRGGGHLAWLDATYDQYVAVGTGGITADVAGHRLSNAPEWSGRLWLEWNCEIGRAGVLSLRADSMWQSTVFFTPFNDGIQRQSPYGLLELSADLESPGRGFSVGAYARNLTNEDYITGTFSSPPPAIGGRPGDSRQIGVQLTVRR